MDIFGEDGFFHFFIVLNFIYFIHLGAGAVAPRNSGIQSGDLLLATSRFAREEGLESGVNLIRSIGIRRGFHRIDSKQFAVEVLFPWTSRE